MAAETAGAGRSGKRLVVGVSPAARPVILAPLLAELLAVHPDLALDIADLAPSETIAPFDAVIRLGAPDDPAAIVVPLTPPIRYRIVGAPAYFERHGYPRRPVDLRAHACILRLGRIGEPEAAWEFDEEGAVTRVPVKGRLAVGDADLALRAAVDGVGLAREIEPLAGPLIELGLLSTALDAFARAAPPFVLAYSAQSPRVAEARALAVFVAAWHERGPTIAK